MAPDNILPHQRAMQNLLHGGGAVLHSGNPGSVIRIESNERESRTRACTDVQPTPAPPVPQQPTQSSSFRLSDPLYSVEDVVLNSDTRDKLDTVLTLIRKHDFIYSTWGLATVDPGGRCIAVNFYGPPGTGKTMCAMALAHAFGKKIVDVDYSELESKYVGETGKNIEAAFRFAKEHGAVLFFDEADSILGKRMSQVTQATDHAVNTSRAVMLKALDHYDGIVVFATNLAENFDKAFTRRILSHIEVGLPDAASRHTLWQKFMMPTVPGSAGVDLAQLVDASADMSGGDMKNAFVKACAQACSEPLACLQTQHLLDAVAQVKKANRDVSPQAPPSVRELSQDEIDSVLNSK